MMLKSSCLFATFVALLVVVAAEWRNVELYSDAACTKLNSVTSFNIANCSGLPSSLFNGSCIALPQINTPTMTLPPQWSKSTCGALPSGYRGYITLTYDKINPIIDNKPCEGNVTSRVFVSENWCITTGSISTKISCSGTPEDGSFTTTTCTSPNCSGQCTTVTASGFSKNKCTFGASIFCGYSSASSVVVSVVATAVTVALAVLFA